MIWDRFTSASPDEWTPENPARGQCAVTALIVQDMFGGELLRTTVDGESHYLNVIGDGTLVDLTAQQFARVGYDSEPEPRDREYVLSFPDTARRYGLLKAQIRRTL